MAYNIHAEGSHNYKGGDGRGDGGEKGGRNSEGRAGERDERGKVREGPKDCRAYTGEMRLSHLRCGDLL